ncbi:jg7364 [Pararge aegeria aegeria]|uniref:Jg7364 protein n=1 Tax=Pararge aegeria aegeria TaxID=348720 RepID=A0A8S4RJU8_9NEOP|nr:jg7364 [Pararge aegeria aegeria]
MPTKAQYKFHRERLRGRIRARWRFRAQSQLRGKFRRSRPLIYISPPIWVNNCPRSAPPSAAIHLATPNHCSPNVKRSLRSMNSPMVRLLPLRGSSANDTRYDAGNINTNILCRFITISVLAGWNNLLTMFKASAKHLKI